MTTTESKRGIASLMVAHMAGMLDLVALPIWVGTLILAYQFAPQQAGGLATLFLLGAPIASMVLAPRLNRINPKLAAVAGFAIACAAFFAVSRTASFGVLGTAPLPRRPCCRHRAQRHARHHRTRGQPPPHLCVCWPRYRHLRHHFPGRRAGDHRGERRAGSVRPVRRRHGACRPVGLVFFPQVTRRAAVTTGAKLPPLGAAVWFSIVAIALMCMTQAMTLSFFERVGEHRGFTLEMVTVSLVICGIVTLFPAPIAALLEKRVAATTVIATVLVFQAVFRMIAMHTSNCVLYTAAGALMAFTIIFVHTFAFCLQPSAFSLRPSAFWPAGPDGPRRRWHPRHADGRIGHRALPRRHAGAVHRV